VPARTARWRLDPHLVMAYHESRDGDFYLIVAMTLAVGSF